MAVEKSQEQMRNNTGDAAEVFRTLIANATKDKLIEMEKI
jgi:hypothetical protein